MKNSRKLILFVVMTSTTLFLTACFGGPKNVALEAVFPKETSVVFAFDQSDTTQVANLAALVAKFPNLGVGSLFKTAIDRDGGGSVTWDKDFAPMFAGKWKMAVSATMPATILSKEALGAMKAGDFDLLMAGKFDSGKAVKSFLDARMKNKEGVWADYTYEKVGDFDYWTNEGKNLYISGYGDVFFFSFSKDSRDAAVKRLKDGGGFNESQKFIAKQTQAGKGFSYLFIDEKMFGFYKNFVVNVQKRINSSKYIDAFGDIYGSFAANVDGFKTFSSSVFKLDSEAAKAMSLDPNFKISLINKIPSKGLIFYSETQQIGWEIDNVINGFEELGTQVAANSANNKMIEPNQLPVKTALQSYIDEKVHTFKLLVQKIHVLLDSPLAVAVSNTGGIVPGVVFYFKLDDKNLDKAKGLITDFDAYTDEMISILKNAGITYFKKDVVAVAGGVLHKAYVDFNLLDQSEKDLVQKIPNFDPSKDKVELYYGLVESNVFVVALYPDFPSVYGHDVLAEDAGYKEAIANLGDVYGLSLGYIRTQPLIDYADRMLDFVAAIGYDIGPIAKAGYNVYFKKFLGTMPYYVSSIVFKNGEFNEASFMKVEQFNDQAVAPVIPPNANVDLGVNDTPGVAR